MIFNGIAGSGGIGIGKAVVIGDQSLDFSDKVFTGRENERKRLLTAVDEFCSKTTAMWEEMKARVGEKEAAILNGQIMMIQDPFMLSQMNEYIDEGRTAEMSLDMVCRMYIDMFSAVEDELTRQRATDIRDIRERIMKILLGAEQTDISELPEGSVIIAKDFTPSMTVGIKPGRVAAIAAEIGGRTSHSAILARALELPAVLGAAGITGKIKTGDTVIIDGNSGTIIISPDGETLEKYLALQSEYNKKTAALSVFKGRKTESADGTRFELCGNIGKAADAHCVTKYDGEGVGLFRTEFLFMDRNSPPTEEEQFEAYRDAAVEMGEKPVIIRTLDIGGDKDIPYLGLEKEENPFLGHRGIRFCLDNEDLFSVQLRALLRAGAYGNISIMLPMISTADEIRKTKALIAGIKAQLEAQGKPYDKDIRLGIMIETPAAAVISDLLAAEVDFFSIGTNDLTQYTMSVDRGNGRVSSLYSSYNPAVIRLIKLVIENANAAGIPVGMCGESAADPLMIPLLIAFGLSEFSVSPTSILAVRRYISLWTAEEAGRLAGEVLNLTSPDGIKAYLQAHAKL